MDLRFTISILALLLKFPNSVSGADIPGPTNLTVNIWGGEVEVLWDHPFRAPLDPCYHIQMKKYGKSEWVDVKSCIRTKVTYLTHLIKDYSSRYIVRVQLVTKEGESAWTTTKFYPNQSKLLLPSFNLVVTSSSVIVKVYRKPILKKIFLLGMTYSIYLEEMGPDNKTTVKYLSVGENEDEDTVRFDSLHWGRLYCVSIKEMSIGSLFSSEISPQQCLHLPEHEWHIMTVWSLSVLSVMGVFTILVTGILYFLRFSAKMPIALKDTKTGWSPLTVGEIPMEVVTDKGWLLITAETQTKTWLTQKMENSQAVEMEEENGEEDRRTNNDSGVGMKFIDEGTGIATEFQGNSGCNSQSHSESLTSNENRTGESLQERSFRQWDDSGMGLTCQSDSSGSLEVEEQCDPQPDTKYLAGDIYHSQNPCTLDGSDTFHQIPCETNTVLADVVKEYISGHLNCVCLGTDHCVWCQTNRCYRSKKERKYRCACTADRLIGCNRSISHTCEGKTTFSSYIRKTHIQMETVVSMDDWETVSNLPCIDLECDFPLLMAMPAIPLEEEGLSCSMKILPLSLYDVELTIE